MRIPAREQGLRWLEQAQVDLKWVRHLAAEGAGAEGEGRGT